MSEEGRREAFRDLYERSFDEVLSYARRRAVSAGDADDAVAETFLVAWRRFEELPAGERRLPYLYGIARRVLANQHRGEARRRRLTDRLEAEAADERGTHGYSARSEVEDALDSLPADQREILGLAYWEDLDAGEIAVALGCSRNAARIRLHRARRALRGALEARSAGRRLNSLTTPIERRGQ
ncbi:MAG: RNA polymerase sigma factor [Solirubrobacterales bacterium]